MMVKVCNRTECILYDDSEGNHCMEYTDINADCYKVRYYDLEAENKKLRDALQVIANGCAYYKDNVYEECLECKLYIKCPCETAFLALNQSDKGRGWKQ